MSSDSPILFTARDLRCAPGLAPANLVIGPGTLNLFYGPSRETTHLVLRVLGLLQPPASGELLFGSTCTDSLSEEGRTLLRNQRIGFVFSDPFLLPSFSVVENVAMPLLKVFSSDARDAREKTEAALQLAGIPELAQRVAISLPVVDQMRVALARAIAHRPAAIVVEHAETHLGLEEALAFFALLRRATRQLEIAVLVASNSPEARALADQVFEVLENGQIQSSSPKDALTGGME